MAYADFGGKIILHAFGRSKLALAEDSVEVGDLLTVDGYIADAEDTKAAKYVACASGDTDDEIDVALAACIKKPATRAAGEMGWTQADHGGTKGTVLYLDGGADQGQAIESAGTIPQIVGHVLSQDTVMLCPSQYLTSTDLSLSGSLDVGTTLAVAGASTFSGAVGVASGKDVTLTKGNVVLTAGVVKNVLVTAKTETGALADTEQGLVKVSPGANTELTLPAAAAGQEFIIMHYAGDYTVKVIANSGDKIFSSAGQSKDNVIDDKGLDTLLHLRAIDATNWVVLNERGDWTYA